MHEIWWRTFHGLRTISRRPQRESELEEEIRFHLAEEIDERVAGGACPEQARAEARREFGNITRIREMTREVWGCGLPNRWFQDAQSTIGTLTRHLAYTSAVVITLALGIGLNAAVYGLLSDLFLRPPPHIRQPDAVHRVWIHERATRGAAGALASSVHIHDRMGWEEFRQLGRNGSRFSIVAGYTTPAPMQNGHGRHNELIHASWVTGDFFELLGTQPIIGRPIDPADDDITAPPVAVLGASYCLRRFGHLADALGSTVTLGEVTYDIVGVMPRGFAGAEPSAADVWLPLQHAATAANVNWTRDGSGFSLATLVRLPPNATVIAASSAATSALRTLRADFPGKDAEPTIELGPILATRGPATLPGHLRLPLIVGGVAVVVLLIATANVSILLLLRVSSRRRELAVRHALGANRWDVGRLLVLESVVLAALSGTVALGVAALAGRALRVTLLPGYQWSSDPLEATEIAFAAVAALVVGLVASAFPAIYAARGRAIQTLDRLQAGRTPSAPIHTTLIVIQAALSLTLINGAFVFYRSFEAARQVDIGYARDSLLTVRLGQGRDSLALNETTVEALRTRLGALPGVVDVAQATNTPLGPALALDAARIDGLDHIPRMNGAFVNFVTPNFFRVAGLDIRDGRGFADWDRAGSPPVAVVNTTFASLLSPDGKAVTPCLLLRHDAKRCARVVGVVQSSLEWGIQDDARVPILYLPLEQAPVSAGLAEGLRRQRTLVVRTDRDPGSAVPAVLDTLAEAFPDLPADRVQNLDAVFTARIRDWSVGTRLFGVAALLAALLTAFGLYAVVAFAVRLREPEFGIRRALGAAPSDLLRLVLGRALVLALTGAGLGMLGVLWFAPWIEPLLFGGRSARDPLAFVVPALLVHTVALVASFAPARRAARANPLHALQAH